MKGRRAAWEDEDPNMYNTTDAQTATRCLLAKKRPELIQHVRISAEIALQAGANTQTGLPMRRMQQRNISDDSHTQHADMHPPLTANTHRSKVSNSRNASGGSSFARWIAFKSLERQVLQSPQSAPSGPDEQHAHASRQNRDGLLKQLFCLQFVLSCVVFLRFSPCASFANASVRNALQLNCESQSAGESNINMDNRCCLR